MTTIHILFGTESGNAEMAADDIAEALQGQGFDTDITELSEADTSSLAEMELAVFVTSTYGEGSLPETAEPFHHTLITELPDLSNLHYAAFGLGDSGYETFNNGIETLRAALDRLGAQQIGETAKHDAASGESVTDVASTWAQTLMSLIPA
ncbi:flavodoxin domain-containing protein [Rhodococcus fascians]|uniref:flavodoxin domain-containing protein n=1 Tax=Rhodococcoides fascians TaxID=1828 RepID=UPI001C91E657|nr:flavodoxin domain-containing protein [Rhodococcus fascians]MBY3792987.1 flavodoxin domain-containing protein [Rhodococcus fascians]MBY3825744.1 flavodoxin domain-containing protein [Rhodococcus fascians]MBY3836206.1 flavodoxin domain-containing protein [Rhodococcus fascians]MBY3866386.1 flavodoxin domain-containing protein [Rhodococcus fascians]MBY3884888.1 flavodoxin domain-containing protein [Rhodococcus fascians]